MRILVCIASYGTRNDVYCKELIRRYQAMHYDMDIVVLSNIKKDVGDGVETIVGLPTKNPWSLPFGHKQLFAERINDYDLFVYSEDDTPISERNIEAFLKITESLPQDELAGFLRSETSSDGKRYFCDVHGSFHWDSSSVRRWGDFVVAFFSNEHSACYLLTQKQLRRAINSGGFLVSPHEGPYDLLCSAATDPYTQCGFKKVVCISHLDDFIVPHLSSKYAGRLGVGENDFSLQIESLLRNERSGYKPKPLFNTQTHLYDFEYSKSYYEPAREAIISLIPDAARNVLSIGCGWGALEEALVKRGVRVLAVPLDPVIGACASARGIEVVEGDFLTARMKLSDKRFDCLVISNVLHLLPEPESLLHSYSTLIYGASTVIAVVPNVLSASAFLRLVRLDPRFKDLWCYRKTGVKLTSRRIVRKWFEDAGMRIRSINDVVSARAQDANRMTFGIASGWLASEFIVVATSENNMRSKK